MSFGSSLVVFSLSLTVQDASGKYGSVIIHKIYVVSDFQVLNSDEDFLRKQLRHFYFAEFTVSKCNKDF